MHKVVVLAGFLGVFYAAGCLSGEPDARGTAADIASGVPENGMPAVMFLYNRNGSACTCSLISPRVILTAKHCVRGTGDTAAPASSFVVIPGPDPRMSPGPYRVSEVRTAPGSFNVGLGNASDIALLILTTPARETPMMISRNPPSTLVGTAITAVGYGQTASGSSGVKLRTSTDVRAYQSGFLAVGPSVCPGDSGGPAVGGDGQIYGVASFIYSPDGRNPPTCGTAPGAYNAIYDWLSLIDTAIRDSGECIPTTPATERCDSVDNDCNGMIDETCLDDGMPCMDDAECKGLLCVAPTGSGRLCSRACDPLRRTFGCETGFYCTAHGNDGICVRGTAGTRGIGEACSEDMFCLSLYCEDPGDAMRRCLAPCRGDNGQCLSGEACASAAGQFGACVTADLVTSPRGMGEPCTADGQCTSGVCHTDGSSSYCSRACVTLADCGEGFSCREGLCERGVVEGVGGPCATNMDCAEEATCMTRDGRAWCTVPCGPSSPCPSGFSCVNAGDAYRCAPIRKLLGEPCMSNFECTTDRCNADRSACTRSCDHRRPCPDGYACERQRDGEGACLRPRMTPPASASSPSHGCAASSGAGLGWIWMVLATMGWIRRRAA